MRELNTPIDVVAYVMATLTLFVVFYGFAKTNQWSRDVGRGDTKRIKRISKSADFLLVKLVVVIVIGAVVASMANSQ